MPKYIIQKNPNPIRTKQDKQLIQRMQPKPHQHQLLERQRTNESFRNEMYKANENYNLLKKIAIYSNLSAVNEILLSKFELQGKSPAVQIYFVYGIFIDEDKVSMDRITNYFVSVFPKPKRPYIFVYFNDFDSNNNFSNFKNMLSIMPIQYFTNLQQIFLVRPTLKMKASRYFTFGTISKYINNKIVNVGNINELSQKLGVRREDILHFLPLEVRGYFADEEIDMSTVYLNVGAGNKNYGSNSGGYQVARSNSKNSDTQSPGLKPSNMTLTQKLKSQPKSQVQQSRYSQLKTPPAINPVPPKLQIDQYVHLPISQTKSQRGIPEIFQILLIYFREHNLELEEEGIFRKSVSIEEQTIALEKMHRKEYDYLEKVKDPHLVANLIKRFLSKLKTPIIPYKIFQSLMQTHPLDPSSIAPKMKELYVQSQTKYLTLMTLLDFMNRKVIPRSYKNKMSAQNIAICFAPCLMWAQQRSIKDLTYINKSVGLVLVMLNQFEEIFGTKKEISKAYRNSFFQQQKKSLTEAYINQNQSQNQNQLQQARKTPNFGLLILQKAEHDLKALQQHSDISDNEVSGQNSQNISIKVVSPNKGTKSQVQKSQLLQTNKQLNNMQRKSQQDKNQKKIVGNIDPNQFEPNKSNSGRKLSGMSSKSNKMNAEVKDRVSSSKSNEEINSIHSDH